MAAVTSIIVLIIDVIVMVPCLQGSSPVQVALGGSWGSETRRWLPNPSCRTENNDIPEQEDLTANRTLIQEGQPGGRLFRPPASLASPRDFVTTCPPLPVLPQGDFFFNNNEILCKKEFGGRWRKRGGETMGGGEGGDQSKKRTTLPIISPVDNAISCLSLEAPIGELSAPLFYSHVDLKTIQQ